MMNMGNMMNFAAKLITNFKSNFNVPSDLSEIYTAKFYISQNSHHIITFQFTSSIFH